MAEDRSEDSDVVASSITYANNCPFGQLVGQPEPRSEVMVVVLDVEIPADISHPTHSQVTGIEVEE